MDDAPLPSPHVGRYDGLLGTVVEVRIHAEALAAARDAERAAVAEVRRLEQVFSVYDAASTLVRWRSGRLDDPGPELGAVLARALAWQERSGGVFNPFTGELTQRWRRAAEEGVEPTDAELDALAVAIAAPRFALDERGAVRLDDCGALDLNAFAKGWIVDAALAAAMEVPGVVAATVNAGGDLARRGPGRLSVGVENPRRPFDNEPPLAVVTLTEGAVATTGGARRGVRVGGVRRSHVLDPRTGRPVDHVLSATVLATDAATADVVATVAGVLPPAGGVAFVDGVEGASCLIVGADGAITISARWPNAPRASGT